MFCIKCGKKLHDDYKYLACSDCFISEHERKAKERKPESYYYGFSGVAGEIGVTGMMGVSGIMGVSGVSSYNGPQTVDKVSQIKDTLIEVETENPYFEKSKRLLRPIEGEEIQ